MMAQIFRAVTGLRNAALAEAITSGECVPRVSFATTDSRRPPALLVPLAYYILLSLPAPKEKEKKSSTKWTSASVHADNLLMLSLSVWRIFPFGSKVEMAMMAFTPL